MSTLLTLGLVNYLYLHEVQTRARNLGTLTIAYTVDREAQIIRCSASFCQEFTFDTFKSGNVYIGTNAISGVRTHKTDRFDKRRARAMSRGRLETNVRVFDVPMPTDGKFADAVRNFVLSNPIPVGIRRNGKKPTTEIVRQFRYASLESILLPLFKTMLPKSVLESLAVSTIANTP